MKKLYTIILSLCFVSSVMMAQEVDIEIKVKNYDNDTLIVGNYYADRQLVKDTLIRKKGDKCTTAERARTN